VDGGNTASYTYDALNRRVRVANASGTDDYTFDAMGRRVTEWQESTNSGIEASEYWGASSERIAYRNGPTVFEQQDWLGTERVRTTASGAVQSDYASLPSGDGFSGTGSDPDPAHFAGLDHDAESSTDHAQYRQYSEAMGRWMSPDPYDGSYDWSNSQNYNRYAYVMGNPLGLVDPSGYDGGAAIGAVISNITVTGTDPLDAILSLTLQTLPIAGEIADAGLGVFDLGKLLGLWGGPQFQGTLQPRPNSPSASIHNGDYVKTNFTLRINVIEPNSGIPWYGNVCIMAALGEGALSASIDAIGLIPEGGGAKTIARKIGNQFRYRGVVADNFGKAAIQQAKGGTGAFSATQGLAGQDWVSTGLSVAGFIPGVGQAAAALSISYDIYKTAKAVSQCP
jgi:RHS repeat-associated protein